MRRMRGVGLVLIDIGSGGVYRTVGVVGAFVDTDGGRIVAENAVGAGAGRRRAGQHHEIGLATVHIERIVRQQRDEHRAVSALGDEVEAVVEELAEQGEPGVEWSRKPLVWGGVDDLDVGAFELDPVGLEQGHQAVICCFQCGACVVQLHEPGGSCILERLVARVGIRRR